MKKVLIALIPLILSLLTLIVLWGTFTNPHPDYYNGKKTFPYAEGNAPEEIRRSIQKQLAYFEEGYMERDVEILDAYCERLISKDNILILGTMPGEIYSGYEAASELIETDWLYWGDVYFLMDQANISIEDSVVWISTIGYVEFDMSSFLVLPLRYSGVMVMEGSSWKFEQMQFQFDLDNLKVLMAIILLLLSSIGFFIRIIVLIIRIQVQRRRSGDSSGLSP